MWIDRNRPGRGLERLLVACVREHDWNHPPEEAERFLPSVNQERLVELAQLHRVEVAVGLSLVGSEHLRPDVARRLERRRQSNVMRQLLMESELQRIDSTLDGIPWLVVKGPALSHGYYRRPEIRSYGDLDILVKPERLSDALRCLEGAGYLLLDRNWTLLHRRLSGELHLLSPNRIAIDLHWDLFNDRATRNSFAMLTRTFFARSRRLRIASREVRTLDDLDTMVHTAVHAARSGGDRLVWMKDLEQLVLSRRFSWEELAERCEEHHARLPVSVMLQRMQATLQTTGLTGSEIRRVGGSALWRRLGRVVDRVAPVARAAPTGSLTRMYARATRADGRQTTAEMARRLTARARRTASPREDRTWDESSPESVLYESGGEEGKHSFLRAVASGL